jgi:hypothetical protein
LVSKISYKIFEWGKSSASLMKSVVKVSKFWLMKLESDNLKKRQILIGQQNILYNIWIGKIHRVFFYEIGHFMTKCPIQYLNRENSLRFWWIRSFYDQMSYTIFEKGNVTAFFYEVGRFMTKCPMQYLNRQNSLRLWCNRSLNVFTINFIKE